MADDNEPGSNKTVDDYERPVDDGDLTLRVLASACEDEDGVEFSITLAVQGILIAGQLIGRTRWHREVTEDETLAPVQGATGAFYKMIDDRDDRDTDPREFQYLHLKDAHYLLASGQFPQDVGLYWRGRIGQVSGWSWGALGFKQAD